MNKQFSRLITASTLALTLGASALPAATLAAETSGSTPFGVFGHKGFGQEAHRHGPGVVATLTSMTDNGDGTGTLTLTVAKTPKAAESPKQNTLRALPENLPVAGATITVNYDSETKFDLSGNKQASAADLKSGEMLRLVIVGPREGKEPLAKIVTDEVSKQKHHGRALTGTIESVDVDANTFVVTLPAVAGHPEVSAKVSYEDKTVFMAEGQTTDESILTVGTKILFGGTLSVDQTTGEVSITGVGRIALAPAHTSNDQ